MTDQPLITVMVPLYNHREYVCEAIESLLAQDYRAREILVIDDGSDDGGPELVEQTYAGKGVRLIRQRRNGCGTTRALNTALAQASGEYICWLSADDWFLPHKLLTQLKAYRARFGSGLGVLHAQPGYQTDDPDYARAHARLEAAELEQGLAAGRVSWHEAAVDPPPGTELFYFFLFNYVNGITIFAPRELFAYHGGFGESFPLTQDYEFWFRLAWRGVPFHVIPECLSISRMHAGNLGRYRSDIPAEKGLIPRLYALLSSPDALAAARQSQGFGPDQHSLFLARIMESIGLRDQMLYWLERQLPSGLPPEWRPIHAQLRAEFASALPKPAPASGETRFLIMLTAETLPSWRWYFCLSHFFEAFGPGDPVRLLIWLPDGAASLGSTFQARLGEIEAYLQAPLGARHSLLAGGDAHEALSQADILIPVASPDPRESRLIQLAQASGRQLLFHAGPLQLRAAVASAAPLGPAQTPGYRAQEPLSPARLDSAAGQVRSLILFCDAAGTSGWREGLDLALGTPSSHEPILNAPIQNEPARSGPALLVSPGGPRQLILVLLDLSPEDFEPMLAPWLERIEALDKSIPCPESHEPDLDLVLVEGLEALAETWSDGIAAALCRPMALAPVTALLSRWPLTLLDPDRLDGQALVRAWASATRPGPPPRLTDV